jgi:hypothetical protein
VTPAAQRKAVGAAIAALALAVAVPFFASTTFVGDDHVFLAFARHASNPLLPFVSDQHGGEYYRPLPMAVWWLLARAGGGQGPFAALALVLHGTAATLVARLLRAMGRPPGIGVVAATFFLLAPQNLEAAYWFSASTDLFATVFVLASLVSLVRTRIVTSALLAVAGYLSKESAFVLPVLGLVVLALPWRQRVVLVAPHVAGLTVVVVARGFVLGGLGASGDPATGGVGKALQLASGTAHVLTGQALMPEVLAFGLGTAILALSFLGASRRAGAGLAPLAFWAVALLPLLATGWAVGARYFYLSSVGLAWAAAEASSGLSAAARGTFAVVLVLLGLGQGIRRHADVSSYDRRVTASRRAVADGYRAGHRIFHVDGGIKDLDLVVKEDLPLKVAAQEVLILNDVPASFAIVPPTLADAATLVVAVPPLPPSGAYRFGDVRVVGLARRGDEPSLDEVMAKFPDIRFIRLRPTPAGRIIARDMTDEIKQRLDLPGANGQD